MATEILVNDGGAPARIIPLTAGAALSGGHILDMQTDGEVDPATDTGSTKTIGYALVDAASGTTASVITGRGVVLNAYGTGTIASGASCEVDAADGILVAGTTAGKIVAIALEAHSGAASLFKVLTK